MKTPDYQKIINSREIEDSLFEKVLEEKIISPDEFMIKIQTNRGILYISEVDYISDFDDLHSRISSIIGGEFTLIPKKEMLVFEESAPVRTATYYKKPEDWSEIQKFAGDDFELGSVYFNFLIQAQD